MIIKDVNGKEREIKDLKRMFHQIPDAVTGELYQEKFVSFTVIGNNREWQQFIPLKDFQENNPEVKI